MSSSHKMLQHTNIEYLFSILSVVLVSDKSVIHRYIVTRGLSQKDWSQLAGNCYSRITGRQPILSDRSGEVRAETPDQSLGLARRRRGATVVRAGPGRDPEISRVAHRALRPLLGIKSPLNQKDKAVSLSYCITSSPLGNGTWNLSDSRAKEGRYSNCSQYPPEDPVVVKALSGSNKASLSGLAPLGSAVYRLWNGFLRVSRMSLKIR